MTLTEEPQQLLELQKFYVAQVEHFYQQIQEWGKGKVKFTVTDNYPINDKTGDYQARQLTAELGQPNADGLNGRVDFFPQGITFLTEEGIIELHGAFNEEELIYMQQDKLTYTERNGQILPLDQGFEEDDWYWLCGKLGYTKMRRLTQEIFWELMCRCAGYSAEELP